MSLNEDGYRVVRTESRGMTGLGVQLVVGEKPVGKVYPFGLVATGDATRPDAGEVLLRAVCHVLNAGFSPDDVELALRQLSIDVWCVPRITPPPGYTLARLFPPRSAGAILWKTEVGTYARVVDGSGGFVEEFQPHEETLRLLFQKGRPDPPVPAAPERGALGDGPPA